jgi:hypothetical protein
VLNSRITSILLILMLLTLCYAGSVLSQEPELIAQWPLDESSGEVVHDIIGGRDGEFMGDGFEWVPAKFDNGLKFDGAGSHVEIPKTPELECAESVTLMAWFNFSSVAGRQDIVSYADSSAIILDGTLLRGFIFQGGNWPMATGVTTVKPNEWYFAAMTYDSTDVKIYVNGELDGSTAAPGEIGFQVAPFWLGGAPADPGQAWWFNGILDEVEIWNKAMTEDEIMMAYQSPPPSSAVSSKGKLATTTWGELKLR